MKTIKYIVLFLTVLAIYGHPCRGEIYGTVFGKVIDEKTGIGIKDVKVDIILFFKQFGNTKTDDQGKFVIHNIPPGKYGILFRPPKPYAWNNIDHSKFEKDPFVPKGTQTIEVIKGKNLYVLKKCKIGGILEVRTFDKKTNTPIEGVNITYKGGLDIGLTNNRLTNNQGIYVLERLSAGQIEFDLQKEGLWWKNFAGVEIQYNQTTRVDVPYDMDNLTRITGTVTCRQTNEPLKDILIDIGALDRRGGGQCYTNENGYFSMLDMEPGRYEVIVYGYIERDEEKEEFKIEKIVSLFKDHPIVIDFDLDCNLN